MAAPALQALAGNLPVNSVALLGLRRNLEYSRDQAGPPSLERARAVRKTQLIRGSAEDRKCSLFSTSVKDLGEYGIGLELYLTLIKELAILFFVISVVSCWPLTYNASGEWASGNYQLNAVDMLTIANINSTPTTDQSDIEKHRIQVSVPDLLYSSFFLIFLLYYRRVSQQIVARHREKLPTPADFTVQVKGFNQDQLKSLEDHFKKFQAIEVVPGRFDNSLLLCKKLIQLQEQKSFYQELCNRDLPRHVQMKACEERINRVLDQLKQVDQRPFRELPVRCAFVVFSSSRRKDDCLHCYRDFMCSSYKNQRTELMLDGANPLQVKQAPQPNDILWENVKYRTRDKIARKLVSYAIGLVLCFLSAIVLLVLRNHIDSVPTKQYCAVLGVNLFDGKNATEILCLCNNLSIIYKKAPEVLPGCTEYFRLSKNNSLDRTTNPSADRCAPMNSTLDLYSNTTLCYCDLLPLADSYNEDWSLCKGYLELLAKSYIEKAACSIFIIIINYAIEYALLILVGFQKSMNRAKANMKAMEELLLFTFINTSLVTILLYANFNYFETYIVQFLFSNGYYDDFSRDWYIQVGKLYQITMVLSMFLPHACTVLASCIFAPFRRCQWKTLDSQRSLNKRFAPWPFNLGERMAILLTFVFSCFLISGGIPMLNVICALGLIIIYWSEKYLVLNFFAAPSEFDHMMNNKVQVLLPVCVAMHCACSLYMYGASDIFPNYDKNGKQQINWLYNRINTNTGYAFLVLIVVSVMFSLAPLTLQRLFKKCFRHKDLAYSSCEKKMRGLHYSYDITDNPSYDLLLEEREVLFGHNEGTEEASIMLTVNKDLIEDSNLE